MKPIQSCIFTPTEAANIAAGNSTAIESLKSDICSILPSENSKVLQEQFQPIVAANPKAVAFLWRGEIVEAFQPGRMPTANSCANMVTPERCEAVVSLGQGKLSHMKTIEEENALGRAFCNWRHEEIKQDKSWRQYFNEHKSILNNPAKRKAMIQNFSGYSDSFESFGNIIEGKVLPKFTESDARLLGALVLVSDYLKYPRMLFAPIPLARVGSVFCDPTVNCVIVSTRVLDLLWQSGTPGLERVERVGMTGHETLRIRLEDNSYVYFNNKNEFLPGDHYRNRLLETGPAWQIIESGLMTISINEGLSGDLDGVVKAARKALQIVPNSLGAYVNLAYALARRDRPGDLDSAIAAGRQAIKIDPMEPEAHNNLGYALAKKGDLDGAIAEYRRALEIDPKNEEAREGLRLALKQKYELEVQQAKSKFLKLFE